MIYDSGEAGADPGSQIHHLYHYLIPSLLGKLFAFVLMQNWHNKVIEYLQSMQLIFETSSRS